MKNKLPYSEFIQVVVKELKTKLNETVEVETKEVLKNNDVDRRAILIRERESNVFPTIYMEEYYQDYLNGKLVTQITENILDVLDNYKMNPLDQDYEMSLDNVQDKIVFRLLNFNSNQKFLSDKPYIQCVDDLVMTFHWIVKTEGDGIVSICITNACMEKLGLTLEKLKDLAMVNTRKIYPEQIKCMDEILPELIDEDAEMFTTENDKKCRMYVISNQSNLYGAGCILYPKILYQFSDTLQSDLLILPASVHEVIVIPYTEDISIDAMREMVWSINRTEVSAEEVLSDNVYIYEQYSDSIHVA